MDWRLRVSFPPDGRHEVHVAHHATLLILVVLAVVQNLGVADCTECEVFHVFFRTIQTPRRGRVRSKETDPVQLCSGPLVSRPFEIGTLRKASRERVRVLSAQMFGPQVWELGRCWRSKVQAEAP